jgi:hypothetical protein
MAFFILDSNDGILNIAANEAEKNNLNVSIPPAISVTVTEDEFNKFKKGESMPTVNNGSVTFEDVPTDVPPSFVNQEALKDELKHIQIKIKQFKNISSNQNKILWNTITTYGDLLDSFDFSSITYPLNKTWEQYCEDNSITYIHPLQIP